MTHSMQTARLFAGGQSALSLPRRFLKIDYKGIDSVIIHDIRFFDNIRISGYRLDVNSPHPTDVFS